MSDNAIAELIERLENAENTLKEIIRRQKMDTQNEWEIVRLGGKIEGVRLALSYLKEGL